QRDAFRKPFVDPELAHDQWGTFLSGTAPIEGKGASMPARYVIGFDLDVSEFETLTNLALLPFALFVVFLLIALSTLTIILKRMWQSQVMLLDDIDRQKDELLGMIAHQLSTPITAVAWSTEGLLAGDSGPLTPAQQTDVGTIRSVAFQLADLVTMMLDVSRIQLGKVPITDAPLDLGEMFRDMLGVIGIKAQEKGVSLTVSVPPALPIALLDKRYTRMAVENLLSNAVKYTPTGGSVAFTVELRDDVLRCTVTDTGCGIPASEHEKIFGKLYRASNVRNTQDGNGFGLYLAKGAVEAQGGHIWFQSAEGKGTTFHLELPLRYPARVEAIDVQANAPQQQ
ncbi:MAG TPA: HAMP domain-containing sensor histidine kinase, partial [Gemmataceae bacterium]|nr:HAMP domain-containing sensor histidine kinase [Gemmataceae bacterium]